MLTDENNKQEDLKNIKELFMDKKIIKEELGVRRYYFFKACLFSKDNDCNMRYNPEVENSKCNNNYFKSIIDDVNNIEKLKNIHDINDLKDHLLYLKQNGIVNIKTKEDSIQIIPNYNDKDLFIYPVKKKTNYHLFHGTSIENAKSILKEIKDLNFYHLTIKYFLVTPLSMRVYMICQVAAKIWTRFGKRIQKILMNIAFFFR